jgi:hypothetical protein
VRVALLLTCVVGIGLSRPSHAAAQFEEPCELTCVGVLGATGFVVATGASIAVGRTTGGLSTVGQGAAVWGASFAAVAGGAVALSGNGARQERAVYAAGIGTLGGALVGLAMETIRADRGEAHVIAGTLIGATLGAVAGGVYGALSYDSDSGGPVPLMSVNIPF